MDRILAQDSTGSDLEGPPLVSALWPQTQAASSIFEYLRDVARAPVHDEPVDKYDPVSGTYRRRSAQFGQQSVDLGFGGGQ